MLLSSLVASLNWSPCCVVDGAWSPWLGRREKTGVRHVSGLWGPGLLGAPGEHTHAALGSRFVTMRPTLAPALAAFLPVLTF